MWVNATANNTGGLTLEPAKFNRTKRGIISIWGKLDVGQRPISIRWGFLVVREPIGDDIRERAAVSLGTWAPYDNNMPARDNYKLLISKVLDWIVLAASDFELFFLTLYLFNSQMNYLVGCDWWFRWVSWFIYGFFYFSKEKKIEAWFEVWFEKKRTITVYFKNLIIAQLTWKN